jgi:DNA-binding transcriptional ArsR family regulator
MDTLSALGMFETLSQETRLQAFRLLVKAGPEGLPAGELSKRLGTPHNTLSFHLAHLSRAGIIQSQRQGRSIIYSACFDRVQALIEFLVEDCCGDRFASIRRGKGNRCDSIEFTPLCT